MFSQASVILSGGGACVVWGGGMYCGGMHGKGDVCGWGRAWQERRPLQRTVRILLERILVLNNILLTEKINFDLVFCLVPYFLRKIFLSVLKHNKL